jgi:hypothetical protein
MRGAMCQAVSSHFFITTEKCMTRESLTEQSGAPTASTSSDALTLQMSGIFTCAKMIFEFCIVTD